ncbi:MAG: hypothetical protein AAFV07_20320, partial [Bacteroidota bacterium]
MKRLFFGCVIIFFCSLGCNWPVENGEKFKFSAVEVKAQFNRPSVNLGRFPLHFIPEGSVEQTFQAVGMAGQNISTDQRGEVLVDFQNRDQAKAIRIGLEDVSGWKMMKEDKSGALVQRWGTENPDIMSGYATSLAAIGKVKKLETQLVANSRQLIFNFKAKGDFKI